MNSFPLTIQHDSMQCGVACIQMGCKHYGKNYSLDSLSLYCYHTTQGVSMQGLCDATIKIGFQTLCGRTTLNAFQESPLPCILHWNQNHFIVLYKIQVKNKKTIYHIADPNIGLCQYLENIG